MEHAPSKCAYYDGGFCLKGLPGTLCELQGCVAWTDDLSVRPATKAQKIEIALREILEAIKRIDRLVPHDEDVQTSLEDIRRCIRTTSWNK